MSGRDNKYSLTYPQKNIWLVDKFYGDTPINTIAGTLEISKDFNIESCSKAINKMVEMNDALRLKVFIEDGQPMQKVNEYTPFEVDLFNMAGKSEKEILELKDSIMTSPMNIEKDGCFSFAIIAKEKGKGIIVVKLHHIVSDAWTFGRVGTSLAEYIERIESTTREWVEEKKPSYTEYIQAEKEYIESDKYLADKEFWTNYLDGINEVVGLKEETKKVSTKADRYSIELEKDINAKIVEYAKANRLSPYTIFMTALAIYIHRTTSKQDFIIGTPVLNRSNFKEKQMMGMFVSTMPVRYKIDEKDTFIEMCKKNASEFMTLFRHQKYPYSLTLEEIHKKTDIKDNLYRVMLSYQNAKAKYPDEEKYSSNWIFSKQVEDDFAIHIMDMDSDGTMHMHFDYRTDLFERIEVEYIASRILAIIEDGIDNNRAVEDIEIMTAAEKNKILYEFNDTDSDYPKDKTVIQLFEEQVEKTPDNIALVFEDKQMTYRELNEKANSVAYYLKELGVEPRAIVTLLLERGFNQIIVILAILKLGCAYLPVSKEWPKERIEYIISNSMTKYVIVDGDDILSKEKIKFNVIDIRKVNYTIKKFKTVKVEQIALAYIIYTSGSTGNPKGTMITNRNVVRLLFNDKNPYNFNNKDIWTMFHSYTFDFSVWEMYGALLYGGKLILVDEQIVKDPKQFITLLEREKVTILNQTPAYFYKLVETDMLSQKKQLRLRCVIFGGEALNPVLIKDFAERYSETELINMYGITETTVHVTYKKLNKEDLESTISNIGKPIPTLNVYIFDTKNRIMPLLCDGEICVSGLGLGLGYLYNEELTKIKFIENNIVKDNYKKIYKSGDVGRLNFNGDIEYLGRNDNQIKIRGFRVEIGEIENKILKNKDIKNVVIVVKKNEDNTNTLFAFYTAIEPIHRIKLLEFLEKNLPSYMIPVISYVEDIPLTLNGKVDRKLLLENLENKQQTIRSVKKYSKEETDLIKIIEILLNIKIRNIDDNIFDYDIDSLKILQFVVNLNKLGIIIDAQEIYNLQYIRKIINNIVMKKSEDCKVEKPNFEISQFNKRFKYDCKGVLITGATGFLGAHIMKELLDEGAKVYCLVRQKGTEPIESRINNILKKYFNESIDKYKKKLFIIKGDYLYNDLCINYKDKNKIIKNIDSVIHAGANVKHYGKYEDFYNDNVGATQNIINFCKENNKKMAHISTVSVAGYKTLGENNKLTENDIYINQNFNKHVYMITKYEAELLIIKEVIENNLNAKIFRIGNIMNRYSDNVFQINKESNSFVNRIKTILKLGCFPKEYENIKIELSPVDICAKAIVTLMKRDDNKNIYHIKNDYITLKQLMKYISRSIEAVKVDEFYSKFEKLKTKDKIHLMQFVTLDNKVEVEIDDEETLKILNKNNVCWKEYNEKYIQNSVNKWED